MTKNELIAYMQSIITTNSNNEITGALVDDVLETIINVVWETFTQGALGDCPLNFRGEINFGYTGTLTIHRGDVFVNAAIGAPVPEGSFAGDWIINLDEGEEDLLSVTIGESNEIWFYLPFGAAGSGSMTAAQIRDSLQTLALLNRLNKSAILGADFALNRRGALQWDAYTVQGTMTDILPGDCWVYTKALPGEDDTYLNGDILVLLTSNPGTPQWTLTDTSKFWIIPAGHIEKIFTAAEKTKLTGIEAGAEVNVQSDWNQATNTADDYIKNKPVNATQSVSGFMSAADKEKLDSVADNANNYSHPTGDGNLHVPATGTGNSGKVLTAGASAGSISWRKLTEVISISGSAPITVSESENPEISITPATTSAAGSMSAADKIRINEAVTISDEDKGNVMCDNIAIFKDDSESTLYPSTFTAGNIATVDMLTKVIGVRNQGEIEDYYFIATDAGYYLRYTGATNGYMNFDTTNTALFATGTVITLRQAGAGTITIGADYGITINGNASTAGQHTAIQCVKVSDTVWDVIGGVA